MKIAILVLAIIATVTTFGQSDFSGNWKLNAERSKFNNVAPSAAPVKLVVEQKAGVITYQRNERPKESLKIDSTASITITDGDNKTIVSMKPAVDKKGLIETRVYLWAEGQEGKEAKKVRAWSLSADNKSLTILDHIEALDGGMYEMELVYEKQ